jgi:hypothetical protein
MFALDVIFDQIAVNYGFPDQVGWRNLLQISRSFEQARTKHGRSIPERSLDLQRVNWNRAGLLSHFEYDTELPIHSIHCAKISIRSNLDVRTFIAEGGIHCTGTRFELSRAFAPGCPPLELTIGQENTFVGFKIGRLDLKNGSGLHKFVSCDFTGAYLDNSSMRRCEFEDCSFRGSNPPRIHIVRDDDIEIVSNPRFIAQNYPLRIRGTYDLTY